MPDLAAGSRLFFPEFMGMDEGGNAGAGEARMFPRPGIELPEGREIEIEQATCTNGGSVRGDVVH